MVEDRLDDRPLVVGGGEALGRALDGAQCAAAPRRRSARGRGAPAASRRRASRGRRRGRPRSPACRGRRARRCGRRRRRRAGAGRARPARRGGDGSARRSRPRSSAWRRPASRRPGESGGVPSAWASASAVAKPMPSSSVSAVGVRAQRLDGARAVGAVDARGHRRGHAVLLEEQPHRAQRALVLPRAHRRADARLPDPGHRAQRALGVAVDGGQDLLGAVALEQPRRPARPDVLDRAQIGEQGLLAGGLLDARALGHEAPAVARMALPAALRRRPTRPRGRGRALRPRRSPRPPR